jgi:hypothetical protein
LVLGAVHDRYSHVVVFGSSQRVVGSVLFQCFALGAVGVPLDTRPLGPTPL